MREAALVQPPVRGAAGYLEPLGYIAHPEKLRCFRCVHKRIVYGRCGRISSRRDGEGFDGAGEGSAGNVTASRLSRVLVADIRGASAVAVWRGLAAADDVRAVRCGTNVRGGG